MSYYIRNLFRMRGDPRVNRYSSVPYAMSASNAGVAAASQAEYQPRQLNQVSVSGYAGNAQSQGSRAGALLNTAPQQARLQGDVGPSMAMQAALIAAPKQAEAGYASQPQTMNGNGRIRSDAKLGDLPWMVAPDTVASQRKRAAFAGYGDVEKVYVGEKFRGENAGKRMATKEEYLRGLREFGEDPTSEQGVPRGMVEGGGVHDQYSSSWLDNVTRNWNGLQDESYYNELVRYILGDEEARAGSLAERDSLGMSEANRRLRFYQNALRYRTGPNGYPEPNGNLSPLTIDEADPRESQKKLYNAAAFSQYLNARNGASLVNVSGRKSPFDTTRRFNGYAEAIKQYIQDGGQEGFEDFTLRYVDGNA